jgi:gas vesicle protein
MTKMFRNRLFLQGILFGGVSGLVVGSLVALQIGSTRVDGARHSILRIVRRKQPRIDYRHLVV